MAAGTLLRRPAIGLLAEPAYRRLWLAQTVSYLGSGVTGVALPLTAVLALGAGALEMGVLRAAANTPILLLGLVAGVWVDRLPRRPVLVAADLGRALLIGAVPLLALLGLLRIELLWLIAFLVGGLALFFDVAVTSYLPALVRREQLVEGNARLRVGAAAAEVAGPGLAGWLVQAVGAPLALLADAASFLASAALLGAIRVPETAPHPRERPGFRREVAEGVRFVWYDPVLRALTAYSAIGALGGSVQGALLVLFAVRELGATPAALGLLFAGGGAAGVVGAALAGPAARRCGAARAIVLAQVPITAAAFAVAAATGPWALGVLAAASVLSGLGFAVAGVNQLALRQAVTPPALLGRVNATRRVLVFGVQPLGALLGGALGAAWGLRPALFVGALIALAALAFALRSPLARVRAVEPG